MNGAVEPASTSGPTSVDDEVVFDLGRKDRKAIVLLFLAGITLMLARNSIPSVPPRVLFLGAAILLANMFGLMLSSSQRLQIGKDRVSYRVFGGGWSLSYGEIADLRFFRGLSHYGTLTYAKGRRRDVVVMPWNGVFLAEAFRLLERRAGLSCPGLAETPRRLLDAVRDATGLEDRRRLLTWIRRHLFQFRLEMAAEAGPSIQAPLRLFWASWVPLTLSILLSVTLVFVRFVERAQGTRDLPFLDGCRFWIALVLLTSLTAVVTFVGITFSTNLVFLLVSKHAREKDDLAGQLAAARKVQQDLLPRETPSVRGFEISGTCEPAQEVGGDYFDFIAMGDGTTIVAVGDVSGKGLPAAFLMTLTKGSLRSSLRTASAVPEALAAVNWELKQASSAKAFVTLALVRLSPDGCGVEVTRAGHTPPLLVPADGGAVRWLRPSGLALGLTSGPVFARVASQESLALAPGDVLLVYSDGVTEAMDVDGNEFGDERLREVVVAARGSSADAIRRKVLESVTAFRRGAPVNDDITLVVLRRILAERDLAVVAG